MQQIEIHLRTPEPRILLNSQEPAAYSPLAMLMMQPLPVWTERLFDELCETFNGARQYEVRFQGSEADWQTLATAAEKARAQGMDIVLHPYASGCSVVQRTVAYPSLISQSLEGQRSMQHIEITHNPFTVNTDILVNGEQPAEGSPLATYREQRLQRWVEGLFDKLSDAFNGATDFKLTFKGVESDWLDIKDAAEKAEGKGMRITLEHAPFAKNGEERLQDLMALKEKAQTQDLLNLLDGDFRETFQKALDRDFDVFVVATMSSGKSTLINAILGQDLLPAANEATTATIAEIRDNDKMPSGVFNATCENHDGEQLEEASLATKEVLEAWNKSGNDREVFKIKLEGNIQGVREREHVRLVLTDTPGPNNSQTEEHKKTTMACIQDESKQPLIIYVLNGTQLGTDDDKRLLTLVSKYMKKGGKQGQDRFLFVANKMDSFDAKKESLPAALERIREYLNDNGIIHPQVLPVSARFAYLLRTDSATLSEDEGDDLESLRKKFNPDRGDERNMEGYMSLTKRVRNKLEERQKSRELSVLLRRSGIPALESIIDEYIDKYCFPYRVKHAYDALLGAIHKANNKNTLELQLDQDAKVLEQIKAAVAELKVRANKSFDVEAYKAKIEREDRAVPTSVEDALYNIQQDRIPVIAMLDNRLQGEVSPSEARHLLDGADKELRFLHNKMVNAYEVEFKKAQDVIRADLKVEYQAYVQSLFPESGELKLPVLDSIKQSLGDISLNLGVRNTDVQEKAIYERQERAWYNPRRWFGDSYTLERVGTKEIVDLGERWAEAKTEVEVAFRRLLENAQEHIQFGHEQLLDDYLAFMTQQFDKHVAQLMAELDAKLSDQKQRETAIAQAKVQLDRINGFEAELKAMLEV